MDIKISKDTISDLLFDLAAVEQSLLLIKETHPVYADLLALLAQTLHQDITTFEKLLLPEEPPEERL